MVGTHYILRFRSPYSVHVSGIGMSLDIRFNFIDRKSGKQAGRHTYLNKCFKEQSFPVPAYLVGIYKGDGRAYGLSNFRFEC